MKAATIIIICGVILITFQNWISKTKFSVGWDNFHATMTPIYLGVIFAFVLCPIYNSIVKKLYKKMLSNREAKLTNSTETQQLDENGEMIGVSGDEKRKILTFSRVVASTACMIILCGVVGMMIYFVVPQVITSLIELVNTLPQRLTTLASWLETNVPKFPQLSKWVENLANAGAKEIIDWIKANTLYNGATDVAVMISAGVFNAIKYIANVFIGMLVMIYLLNYKEKLFAICRKGIAAMCGQKKQEALYEFSDIVNETFIGFIVGRVIDSFIIGVLNFIIMILIGMPFAPMISVIVGVTNIIPFFGPFIGAVPSVLILMLEDPIQALWFIVIVLAIQQLDGNVIGPKIVGSAIGISSFWVLIAVLIGGGLFGFMGMAFGVPVFAVIYRYIDKIAVNTLKKKEKDVNTNDYLNFDPFGIEVNDIELEKASKKKDGWLSKMTSKGRNSDNNKDK